MNHRNAVVRVRVAVGLCAALVFAGCSTQPFPRGPASQPPATTAYANELLRRAQSAAPQERRTLLLQAAAQLALEGDLDWAQSILGSLPEHQLSERPLPAADWAREAIVRALLAERLGDLELALQAITSSDMDLSRAALPRELQIQFTLVRARLQCAALDYAGCAATRVGLHELLPANSAESAANADALWRSLANAPDEVLMQLSQTGEPTLRGWTELAALYRSGGADLNRELEDVQRWTRQHPDHPASLSLPTDLALLRDLVENAPRQLAILLPYGGRYSVAAGALTDGFMAAYYRAQASGQPVPALRFYDSSSGDINSLVDRALAEGAEAIIGPLEKAVIEELALRPELAVPTLALNQVELPLGAVPNLFQAGLGAEDEARSSAQRLWAEGHRQVLVLAPDTEQGARSAAAFSEAFTRLGGTVAADIRLEALSTYTKAIKQALLINDSEARARQIRSIVGDVAFVPRRRQDVDAIFAVADAAQARQLKPNLAFHFAADIPLYTTGQVFDGRPKPKLDSDMNGVRFAALPWFFAQSPERDALAAADARVPALESLYALGVDSFYLYPRLPLLANNPFASFKGVTGELRMDPAGYVRRTPIWVEFRRGMPERLIDIPLEPIPAPPPANTIGDTANAPQLVAPQALR